MLRMIWTVVQVSKYTRATSHLTHAGELYTTHPQNTTSYSQLRTELGRSNAVWCESPAQKYLVPVRVRHQLAFFDEDGDWNKMLGLPVGIASHTKVQPNTSTLVLHSSRATMVDVRAGAVLATVDCCRLTNWADTDRMHSTGCRHS